MLGFGPLGGTALGAIPLVIRDQIEKARRIVSLTGGGLIVPEKTDSEGILVKSYGTAWLEIARILGQDWSAAFQIDDRRWEEILAGAFDKDGFKVTLTPRSGDHGRDVIAIRSGVGCIRLLGSMKALGPDYVVTREHVHEMLGVVTAEQATKALIATTTDFAPRILEAPGLAKAIPFRVELMNGERLQQWLKELVESS
jgi:restriction system protein